MIQLELTLALLIAVVSGIRGIWSPCGLSMVSAINPFSERSRGYRYWLTTIWFIAGSVVGGALMGGVAAGLAWGLNPLSQHPALALSIGSLGCLIAVAADTGLGGFHLPLHPRQVNELWLARYRRWLYASGFGLQIGTGFATYIMTAATYLIVLLGALTGSPLGALFAGMTFGLVRGLAVLLSASARDPAALRRLHRRIDSLQPWSLRLVVLTEACVCLAMAFAALGIPGLVVAASLLGAAIVLGHGRPRAIADFVGPKNVRADSPA
jgi:MFS family permease